MSERPEDPDRPETPDHTETPDRPEDPDRPETPDRPEDPDRPETRDRTATESAGGCLLAATGALAGLVYWFPRAAYSLDGGFESHARDLSVLFVALPLILLGATVLPLVTWTLTLRRIPAARRPWPAALAALLALGLFLYGAELCWQPRQAPDPGYGPGI
ncbi:hypothetical protein [Streptomyces sp. NPDC048659]|uniref:hypothetical protein n=1 Tax=Streptomyces sp. NPDC048659 TaxID=3155489 RepID=UPI003424CC92